MVLFLMTLSLAGIILVQWYWITNAIEVRQANYDRDVRSAMSLTVSTLDKKVNMIFLSDEFLERQRLVKPDLSEIKKEFQPEKIRIEEERVKHLKEQISQNEQEIKLHLQKIQGKPDSAYHNLNPGRPFDLEKDSVRERVLSSLPRDSMLQIQMKQIDEQLQSVNWDSINEQIRRQTEKFSDIFQEMAIEYKLQVDSLQKRFPYQQIDTILQRQLREKGITANYSLGVMDHTADSILYQEGGFDRSLVAESYQVNLFPEDLIHKPIDLYLYIPDKQQVILRSVAWLLAGSILFTLIIMATFAITLHIIFKQKKLSEIKSDFINNMTHEFKTPIATVSLAADSVSNPKILENQEQILHFIRIIKSENKRMNNQVERVLQMSVLDKKDFDLDLQPIHVHPFIEQVVNNTGLQLDKSGGVIYYNPGAENDYLYIDGEYFVNVLYNLIDNAVKYSDKYPEIKVETKNRNQYFVLSVIDQGIGIKKEDQTRIFDKFYRVHTGNVHNVKGFGLGLSFVKAVLKEMNGEIRVSSQPGKGSRFEVILPLKEQKNES